MNHRQAKLKNLEKAKHTPSSETLIRLPQSYPASIVSGGGIPLEMWIIWDGMMLHYGLAGRSQNVLFNLYLVASKIECKKSIFFILTPCQIWDQIWKRLDFLLSPISYMFGFPKFQITTELWCLRVKQFLADAKIWRLGRPGKLRGNETENVFLSWLGWLY